MSVQVGESTTSLDELLEHLTDLQSLAESEGFTEFAALLADARLTVLRYPFRFQPVSALFPPVTPADRR
jgi:hypothetical protein